MRSYRRKSRVTNGQLALIVLALVVAVIVAQIWLSHEVRAPAFEAGVEAVVEARPGNALQGAPEEAPAAAEPPSQAPEEEPAVVGGPVAESPAPRPMVQPPSAGEPPSAAAVPEPAPAVAPERVWAVQVASLKHEAWVEAALGELRAAGYECFSRRWQDWYQVLVGPFGSNAEAREALERLRERGYADAFIRELGPGEIR